MKPSLERTAVLGMDLSEQPAAKYVVIVPDMSVTLYADDTLADKNGLTAYAGGEVIGRFSSAFPWAVVDTARLNLVTRKAQLERVAENQAAEHELVKKITDNIEKALEASTNETAKDLGLDSSRRVAGTGVRGYL